MMASTPQKRLPRVNALGIIDLMKQYYAQSVASTDIWPCMKRIFLSLILFSQFSAFGQARKFSNAFLNIGVDARAFGMGQAVVAGVDDVTAAYWNPAGLTKIDNSLDFALMHAEYFASIAQYDYAAAAFPIDAVSTGAVTFIRFGVDDIPDTSELIDENGNVDYNRIQLFSAADYALMFSYARDMEDIEGLSLGGSVKLIYRNIGEFANAYGFGFDLGAQYAIGRWEFGASLRDATSTFTAWSVNSDDLTDVFTQTGNELPSNSIELAIPRLILGSAAAWDLDERYRLRAEIDAEFTFDGQRNTLVSANFGNIDPRVGVELGYKGFAFIRTGVGNFSRTLNFDGNRVFSWQPNLGIGFKYKGISLDYALTDIGDQSAALYSNIFSLKYRLDKK